MQVTLFGNRVILNARDAARLVEEYLEEKGYPIVRVVPENYGRHYGIWYRDTDFNEIRRAYVVFQRDWFRNFKKYFGIDDVAATINLPILKDIVRRGYDQIFWVNMNGEIYMTNAPLMLKRVYKHGWIRKTEKTGEVTAHIPLKMLSKLR